MAPQASKGVIKPVPVRSTKPASPATTLETNAPSWDHSDLAPDTPISGRDAHRQYMRSTQPVLANAGGSLTFLGESGAFLIGPADVTWDLAMLVRHASVDAFMEMTTDPDYLAGAGHRTAALKDSRLLPLPDRNKE